MLGKVGLLMLTTNKTTIPGKAAVLGYAGVIPFAAAAALVTLGTASVRPVALDGFLVYAAVILSFLGGIRWGAASIARTGPGRELVISVLPSLWSAFFLWWPPDNLALWGLMTGFILMGLADWFYPGPNVAAWMRPVRMRLTLAVVACHVVVLVGM